MGFGDGDSGLAVLAISALAMLVTAVVFTYFLLTGRNQALKLFANIISRNKKRIFMCDVHKVDEEQCLIVTHVLLYFTLVEGGSIFVDMLSFNPVQLSQWRFRDATLAAGIVGTALTVVEPWFVYIVLTSLAAFLMKEEKTRMLRIVVFSFAFLCLGAALCCMFLHYGFSVSASIGVFLLFYKISILATLLSSPKRSDALPTVNGVE